MDHLQIIGFLDQNTILTDFHIHPHLFHFCDQAFDMLNNHILHKYPLTHCSRSSKISPRFDAVRDHGVSAAMQVFHTFDTDNIGTGSADFCSHVVQ
ncbi:hypothetical protein SDC9_123745 [bioreactor metagenome]|uniref:Uncharacterized protein n=1 Tax=bioreactor metagenome TaxID=1076179 RepID=A0A645CIG2_9ZZZZ